MVVGGTIVGAVGDVGVVAIVDASVVDVEVNVVARAVVLGAVVGTEA